MTTCSSTKRLSNSHAARVGLTQRRKGAKRVSHSYFAPLRLCVIFLFIGSNAVGEWPFARGGAESTGATEVSLSDEPKLLWTYKSEGSSFEATPVIAAGVAYLGDADGTMHAVRLADGSRVWTTKIEETFLLSPGAIGGTAVYVPDADGRVHCLSITDGVEQWTFDAGSEVYGGPLIFSKKTLDDVVLIPTEAGKLYAIDAESGESRWTFEIEAPLRCTPTVVAGHALLGGCDGKLHAVDIATGEATGSCEIGDPTGNTAAVMNGVAYFGTEGGTFYAIDAGDPAKPTVKWKQRDPKRGQGIRTSAAVTKTAVVYANQAKTLYALDPASGDELWTQRTRSGIEASPLILAGGRVLVLTSRGRVRLLDLKDGDEVWSYEAGGEFLASPAAAGGRVLIANTDGDLLCFGKE